MKKTALAALAAIMILAYGCKDNGNKSPELGISPVMGTQYKAGEAVSIKLSYPENLKADSVVYLLDSVKFSVKKDTAALSLKTDSIPLGSRLITAKVYYDAGHSLEVSTNIVLYAAKAPEELGFVVEKIFPHDTSSYTEGLVYQDGVLYESSGGYLEPPAGMAKDQQSSLRKVDLTTGKVLQKVMNDKRVFAEGISIIGDKLVQISYHEKIGYVYDKKTFKVLSSFINNVGLEGWGMTYDGHKLYMDDSTNRIWFLNKDDYHQTGFIDVYDDKKPISEVNELEYIDGKLYANIYQTDTIIVIDPKTGAVLQSIDLSSLYPREKRAKNADVLNGIAWDAQGKRLFITGKKWPKLYQVKFVKK